MSVSMVYYGEMRRKELQKKLTAWWPIILVVILIVIVIGFLSSSQSREKNIIGFQAPPEWGQLTIDPDAKSNDENIYFKAQNPAITSIAMHKPSGKVAFIEEKQTTYTAQPLQIESTLSVLLKDGNAKKIYKTPTEYVEASGGRIGLPSFSPTGRYIETSIATSIETHIIKIFDLTTSEDILENTCVENYKTVKKCGPEVSVYLGKDGLNKIGVLTRGTRWSEDEKLLILQSFPDFSGGPGFDGLLISEFGSPNKFAVAFDRKEINPPFPPEFQDDKYGSAMNHMNFSDFDFQPNGIVTFTTSIVRGPVYVGSYKKEQETILTRKFQYDTKAAKLSEL